MVLILNQLILFAQLENVSKLSNNNRTMHVNEQNQNKNKTKSRHIQLTTRSIVRLSPQTILCYH